MTRLVDYVLKNATRGDCTCGKCCDAPECNCQPNPDTVDLIFFKVARLDGDKDEFLELVKAEHPQWLDGLEHGFMEVGGDVGDQGVALMTIGLGHLLGAWKCLSPDTMMPFLDKETKMQMAGQGMIALQA